MNKTSILWTEATWNPMSGCEEVSEGCKYCYARRLAEDKRGTRAFPDGFDLTFRPHKLAEPRALKSPALIFVNSMSDLFYEKIPDSYRDKIIDVMEQTPQHEYQVLTKRPELMLHYSRRRKLPRNFWAGVTVEHERMIERIDILRQVDVEIRLISAEPLLSALPDLNLDGIHWIISAGESGRHLWDAVPPNAARSSCAATASGCHVQTATIGSARSATNARRQMLNTSTSNGAVPAP